MIIHNSGTRQSQMILSDSSLKKALLHTKPINVCNLPPKNE